VSLSSRSRRPSSRASSSSRVSRSSGGPSCLRRSHAVRRLNTPPDFRPRSVGSRAGHEGRWRSERPALVARSAELDGHGVGDVIDHQKRGHTPDDPEELSIDLPVFQEIPLSRRLGPSGEPNARVRAGAVPRHGAYASERETRAGRGRRARVLGGSVRGRVVPRETRRLLRRVRPVPAVPGLAVGSTCVVAREPCGLWSRRRSWSALGSPSPTPTRGSLTPTRATREVAASTTACARTDERDVKPGVSWPRASSAPARRSERRSSCWTRIRVQRAAQAAARPRGPRR
jgi:hypothetical protein